MTAVKGSGSGTGAIMLSSTVRMLRGRPPNVERLERRGNTKALLRALSYEDPVTDTDGQRVDLGSGVRVAAAEALTRVDEPAATDGLIRALDDPEESVRVAAIRGLRARGGPEAVGPLTAVATNWSDSDRALSRAEAVDALTALGEGAVASGAVQELLARPAELDTADCEVAARLIRGAGEPAVKATIEELLVHLREASAPARARKLLVALAPESIDPLIEALGDQRARHEAALALGSTGASKAVEPLSQVMLSDEDPAVRRAAAWALGAIRDPAAVEPLLLATRDAEFPVRIEAIDSFEKLGNAGVALAVSALMAPALEESPRKEIEGEAPTTEREPPESGPEPDMRDNGTAPSPAPPERQTTVRRSAPRLRRLIDRYLE